MERLEFRGLLWFTRLTVFLVMITWTLDKVVNPEHAAGVFETFYFLSVEASQFEVWVAMALVQAVLEVGFLFGVAKLWTYGYVLLSHALSTVSTVPQLINEPFGNTLMAGWPMLAACMILFWYRKEDTLITLS